MSRDIKINNVDFNVIENKGRGNCFLYAVLDFFKLNNLNPFVANDVASLSIPLGPPFQHLAISSGVIKL